MDLSRALMLYLSATLAAGIQAAPTPEVTPEPTPAPTVIIATVAPEMTPVPTPAGQTPAPTITPNASYRILRLRDKGDDVRKMQQRLKDLGYLSGNVDGSFGNQTYRAVLTFQRYNNLARDGVAGPMTLTVLYESPSVVANPETMTPTPVPTATPDASGLIPVPEDPVGQWTLLDRKAALYNGEALTLMRESGGVRVLAVPRVWLRGEQVILSLSDLAAAIEGWELTDSEASECVLEAEGWELRALMTEAASAAREPDSDSYCDSYAVQRSGELLEAAQGDVMSEKGEWYVTADFLRRALNAEITWEIDEKTLLIRVEHPDVAEAVD